VEDMTKNIFVFFFSSQCIWWHLYRGLMWLYNVAFNILTCNYCR